MPIRKLVVQQGIVSADQVDEILNPLKLTFTEEVGELTHEMIDDIVAAYRALCPGYR